LLFGTGPLDWGEQIVLITGGMILSFLGSLFANLTGHVIGASGIGELVANTLAVRNVTVVVLDINPIITENCTSLYDLHSQSSSVCAPDNIAYYKCDVSKWEEIDAVAKQVVEEVSEFI